MKKRNSITDALTRIAIERMEARENPNNPICPGCNRRDEPDLIVHPVYIKNELTNVCAECADDDTQRLTGCRFGQENCNHEDCKR